MKKALVILATVALFVTMCLSVSAGNFVSSIEAKVAPEVILIEYNSQMYGSLLQDEQTDEVSQGVPLYDKDGSSSLLEFYVVSVAEKNEAVVPEITQILTNSENQIKKAKDIGKLADGLDTQINKKLDDFYGDSPDKSEIKDLIVCDLFDASLVRDKSKLEDIPDGEECVFIIKPNFKQDDFFVLLANTGDDWNVIDTVEWTPMGYLKITANKMAAFALVVERDPNAPTDSDSPQTDIGTGFRVEYVIIAVVFVGAAMFFFVKAKKKQEN